MTESGPRLLLVLSVGFASFAAVGCSRGAPTREAAGPSTPAGAPLPADPAERQERTVAIATAFAVERGRDRNSFKVRSVKEENGTARVSFDTEPRRPGSHFTVLVDTSTGKPTRLIPGR